LGKSAFGLHRPLRFRASGDPRSEQFIGGLMTNRAKSVSGYGSSALAAQIFDLAGTQLPDSPTNYGQSSDQVIRSLSRALETVELEYDELCADALRRAIAARLAGLRPEIRTATHCGEADNRRPIRALQKWRLRRVIEYVDANLSSKVSLLDLAAVAGLSRMHFASQFRVATGLRPHEFLLRRRIRRSEELLRSSTISIVEIALAVGFQTQAHFTTVFKRFVGCTPREWRTANQVLDARRTRNGARAEIAAVL
jgi:AraC family transcriptional regulator